jgi:hypothetical protein
MRRASTLLVALLLAAACGSGGGGLGDLGNIILGSPSSSQSSDVRGTVAGIDTNARRIDLDVAYVNNLRNDNGGQRGTIYYDNNTRVVYQGRDYSISDLERGDEISVTGVNDNGRYLAQTITVTRDVSSPRVSPRVARDLGGRRRDARAARPPRSLAHARDDNYRVTGTS